MFCCCSLNLKDEAIQVMECHKVRLGSTLIRPVNPRIIKPSKQSSVSIFAQKYLCQCHDTYFIFQNKYLSIYEDSFWSKEMIFEKHEFVLFKSENEKKIGLT